MCVVPSRWDMVGFGVMEHTHMTIMSGYCFGG